MARNILAEERRMPPGARGNRVDDVRFPPAVIKLGTSSTTQESGAVAERAYDREPPGRCQLQALVIPGTRCHD